MSQIKLWPLSTKNFIFKIQDICKQPCKMTCYSSIGMRNFEKKTHTLKRIFSNNVETKGDFYTGPLFRGFFGPYAIIQLIYQ